MLITLEGRKHLTFSRRLRILLGVAQGLHFLHTGETDESSGSTANVEHLVCHRDVKSSNICITRDYQAKIIDCGLGKLIAKDPNVFASFSKSAQLNSGDGGIGTPAYRDPGHFDGDYRYGWYCDMFSFGVVLAECITGTLSQREGTHGSGGGSDGRSVYRKYVHPSKKQRNITEDIDDLISDASAEFLDRLCDLSLACMDQEPDRPEPGSRQEIHQHLWRRPRA